MPTTPEKHAEYLRNRYKNDPEYRKLHIERVNKNKSERIKQANEYISQVKAQGCKNCGESAECCLSFHHLNPSDKEKGIGSWARSRVTIPTIKKEVDKCIVLCENCHRKLHSGLIPCPVTGIFFAKK